MIPKIIHYCWFGRLPLPELAKRCIKSWQIFLPEYEIKEWNEDNFDVNIIPYTAEAYTAKKYAFVSDYARFWILYHYGGLYFDTDVEVIKPIDDIIARGAFMGSETSVTKVGVMRVAPGLGLSAVPGMSLYKELLDFYSHIHFVNVNGSYNLETIVTYTTNILLNYGLKNIDQIQECATVWIYPKDYFCPIDYDTKKIDITNNTRTIHHYASSWLGPKEKLYNWVAKYLGKDIAKMCSKIVGVLRNR